MSRLVIAYAIVGSAMLFACSSNGNTPPPSARTYHFITHADPENPFWNTVRNGMEAGAQRYGVQAEFFGATDPATPAAEQQAQNINEAVAARVDGIAVTISDPAVLKAPLDAAAAAGIPVIAVNVGPTPEQQAQYHLQLATYVGQIETVAAGKAATHARDLITAAGGTLDVALCIKGMNDAAWAIQRCQGMSDTLTPLGVTVTTLGGNFYAQPPVIPRDGIVQWFHDNPNADFVFATAPAVLSLLLSLRLDGTIPASVMIASVDLNQETQDAISGGQCTFAVDQQPYMQGYLPITLFELDNDYLLRVGAEVQTGPFFVDSSNVAEIAMLVSQQIR